MVELVGIELLRILKTGKLLNRKYRTMPRLSKTPAMPDSLYVYCTVICFESNHNLNGEATAGD